METTIVYSDSQSNHQSVDSDKPRKLTVYTIILIMGLLSIAVELQIPEALTLNDWFVDQLNIVEQLLDNPNVLIGHQ